MIAAWSLNRIKQLIQNGGVIAYPTETVYGLGCDPFNRSAVYRLLRIKSRPVQKGLILIAADYAQILPLIRPLHAQKMALIQKTWPGPYTWLLPCSSQVPDWINGGSNRIAVRISNHPIVIQLCQAWQGPLVSTSANPNRRPPARSALQVRRYGLEVDKIIHGTVGSAQPSRIIDAMTGQMVRI